MMRAVFPIVSFMSLLAPASAFAQGANGLYIGAAAGPAFFLDQKIDVDVDGSSNLADIDVEYDYPGYVVAGQIGYAFATNIRAEAEVAYAASTAEATLSSILLANDVVNDVDVETLSGTVGIYLDLWPLGSFVPYVGGGLGVAYVEIQEDGVSSNDQTQLAAFGEAGLPWSLTPEASIVPSVRFNWIATEEDGDEIFADNLYNTQLRIGFRYGF